MNSLLSWNRLATNLYLRRKFFQFSKPIPNSAEVMRIEFMAPAEHKRRNDFRVDIQPGIHARACEGGSTVLAESDLCQISGSTPGGRQVSVSIRVARPTALVMMKLLAIHDRYKNLRGIQQHEHDNRNEAMIHTADVVGILRAQIDMNEFRMRFLAQFASEPHLKDKIRGIVQDYFGDENKPGVLLYEERLRSLDYAISREESRAEVQRAQQLVASLLKA